MNIAKFAAGHLIQGGMMMMKYHWIIIANIATGLYMTIDTKTNKSRLTLKSLRKLAI